MAAIVDVMVNFRVTLPEGAPEDYRKLVFASVIDVARKMQRNAELAAIEVDIEDRNRDAGTD